MKHLSEATLALYAGRELGLVARWRAERHLAHCDQCRSDVEEFTELRSGLVELDDLPGVSWTRLASEMKANIRLGLEAGECVAAHPQPRLFSGPRPAIAFACIALLVIAGIALERPEPLLPKASDNGNVVLQATSNGIELVEGGQTLSLMHGGAQNVTYTAGAQGSMRARYVDSDTGYVMINNLYVQ